MDGRTTHQWILFNQVDAEHVTTYSHLNCSMTEWWWFQPRNEKPYFGWSPRHPKTSMGHDALARPIWVCKTGRILFETFHPQAAQAESQAMPTGRFGKMSLEPLGNPLGTPWEPLGIRILVSFTSPFLSGLLVRWPTSWSPWQNLSAGRRSSTILVRWSRCSRWEYAGHMSYVNLSSTYVRMHGYVWICMYVCLFIYIYVCVCMYIYLYIYMMCMYVYIYIYDIHMNALTCIYFYICIIYIYGHLHLHTHIFFLYIHVYMIIYVYIHCNEVLTWQGSTWLWSAPWIRWPKTYHATDRSW